MTLAILGGRTRPPVWSTCTRSTTANIVDILGVVSAGPAQTDVGVQGGTGQALPGYALPLLRSRSAQDIVREMVAL